MQRGCEGLKWEAEIIYGVINLLFQDHLTQHTLHMCYWEVSPSQPANSAKCEVAVKANSRLEALRNKETIS